MFKDNQHPHKQTWETPLRSSRSQMFVLWCLLQEPQWKGTEGGRPDGSGLSSAGGTGPDRIPRLGSEGTHQCSDHWSGEAEDGAHQKDVRWATQPNELRELNIKHGVITHSSFTEIQVISANYSCILFRNYNWILRATGAYIWFTKQMNHVHIVCLCLVWQLLLRRRWIFPWTACRCWRISLTSPRTRPPARRAAFLSLWDSTAHNNLQP